MEKLKCVLIGETAVGKTSIITQYTNNEFNPDVKSSIGVDNLIKEIEIENTKIKFELWDTPGQEIYTSANKIFMKNTDIALIVYDITNKRTFEKVNHWINLVKEVNENRNLIIGIAANKSDLYENTEVNREEGEEYAKNINALYFESTATDHENVVNIFEELIKAYINTFKKKDKNIIPDSTKKVDGNKVNQNTELSSIDDNNNDNNKLINVENINNNIESSENPDSVETYWDTSCNSHSCNIL